VEKKKWNIWLAALLLVALSVTGYFAIAAEYGSKEDPLVTLSYINDVLSPDMTKKIDEAFRTKESAFTAAIDAKMNQIDQDMAAKLTKYQEAIQSTNVSDAVISAIADEVISKMEGSSTTTAPTQASDWKVLKLTAGQTLTAEVGCEIVLRIGGATCVSSGTPGLINLTDGTDLSNGKALAVNNLYLVTVKGRGITTASGCTILVSGSYTVR